MKQLHKSFLIGFLIMLACDARLSATGDFDAHGLQCHVFTIQDGQSYTDQSGNLGSTGFLQSDVHTDYYPDGSGSFPSNPTIAEISPVNGKTVFLLEDWLLRKRLEVESGRSDLGNFERSDSVFTLAGVQWVVVRYREGANGGKYDETLPVFSLPTLVNMSFRAVVPAGGGQLIPGFVLTKRATVLIRAGGQALAGFGVKGTHPNPALTLFSGGKIIATNDDWGTQIPSEVNTATKEDVFAIQPKIGATPTYADGSKDAALLVTLPAGGYTAFVGGGADNTHDGGEVLVEIYLIEGMIL